MQDKTYIKEIEKEIKESEERVKINSFRVKKLYDEFQKAI